MPVPVLLLVDQGAAYKYGLGWVLLAMIQVPAVWLALGALGKKFALLSRETNALTINDFISLIVIKINISFGFPV